jgi:hypothetical protein
MELKEASSATLRQARVLQGPSQQGNPSDRGAI